MEDLDVVERLPVAVVAPSALSNATTLVGSPIPSALASPTPTFVNDVSGNTLKVPAARSTSTLKPVVPTPTTQLNEAKCQPPRALRFEDFRIIRVLGEGGQGFVSLVQERATDRLYALKAINKQTLEKKDFPTVFVEQDVMKRLAGNPFYTALKGSFEDEDYFFLLTNYYSGGDLNTKIKEKKKLSTDEARLYAAQIVLAMEELRRKRIIHRDLKPHNILINAHGEAIVSDFGLARSFGRTVDEQPANSGDALRPVKAAATPSDKTQSACGTYGYIAPEMLTGDGGHSYEADVWSFAVMLFEMLHGKMPFGNGMEVPSEQVKIDDEVDPDAHDLLQAMLAIDPLRRPTWEQIKEHPWFDSM
ncbi:kinase-like domain-containing protein [Trametes polyzona]|nr:kinase-like domain-containing protein [Trametes polyzona]